MVRDRRGGWMRSLGVPLVVALTWLQLWPMQASPAAAPTVNLTDNAYLPPSVTIQVNDTVTWKVPSSVVGSCHSVSSDDGLFDSVPLSAGLLCLSGGAQSWSHAFTRAGTFRYHCKVVSGMAGVVTVLAPSPTPSPTPPPSPSPSPSPTPTPSVSPTPSLSPSASPSATPSRSPTPTATASQLVLPTTTDSGLAAGTGGGGGSSAATVVAIIAGLIALACAGALIALRRFGAW